MLWIPLLAAAQERQACAPVEIPPLLVELDRLINIDSNYPEAVGKVERATDKLDLCGLHVADVTYASEPLDGLLLLWGAGAYAASQTNTVTDGDPFLERIARLDPPSQRLDELAGFTPEVQARYDALRARGRGPLGELRLTVPALVDGVYRSADSYSLPVGRHVVSYIGADRLHTSLAVLREGEWTEFGPSKDPRGLKIATTVVGLTSITAGTLLLLTEYGRRQTTTEQSAVPIGIGAAALIGGGLGFAGVGLALRPHGSVGLTYQFDTR